MASSKLAQPRALRRKTLGIRQSLLLLWCSFKEGKLKKPGNILLAQMHLVAMLLQVMLVYAGHDDDDGHRDGDRHGCATIAKTEIGNDIMITIC